MHYAQVQVYEIVYAFKNSFHAGLRAGAMKTCVCLEIKYQASCAT